MYEHTFAPNGGCLLFCLSNIFATSGEKMFTNCLLQKNINCLYHFGYCILREMFTFQRPQVRLRDEENRFLLLEQQQNALQS